MIIFLKKCLLKKKNLAIKTLFGGIIVNFIINTYHIPENLSNYFYSYLQYINENIYSKEKVDILSNLSNIIYLISIPFGIELNEYFHFNTNLLIGLSLLVRFLSIYLLIYSTNNKIFFFYLITKSLSSGLCFLPIILEIWKYYPDKKGLILGIFHLGKGFIAFFSECISIQLINPMQIKYIPFKNIYPTEINENFLNYLKISMIIICILGSISQSLIYPYSIYVNLFSYKKNNFIEKLNKGLLKDFYILRSKSIYRKTISSTKSSNNENCLNINEKELKKENYNINKSKIKEPFISLITSYPFLQLTSIYFLIMSFNSIDLSSIFKLGLNKNFDKKFLLFTKIFWILINNIWNILSGYLLDLIKFKKLLIILVIIQIFLITTFYFILNNIFGFILFITFNSIINSSNYIIVPFSFNFIFGDEKGLLLYGISSIIINIFYIYKNYIFYILSEKINFFILCFIFIIFYMVSLIILCFFEEKKHIYKIEDDNQEDIMFGLSNEQELDDIDICDEK